jgi:hypothetical protein
MCRIFIAIGLVCFVANTATAQTKFSATAQCGQADPYYAIPVGDLPDHSLSLLQFKCTYTKPIEIEGAKSVATVITITSEVSEGTFRARGCQVATMDNGDKAFICHEGEGTNGEGEEGTWSFTGGTGKLKGIKGKGKYSCSSSGCHITGEYQLAK